MKYTRKKLPVNRKVFRVEKKEDQRKFTLKDWINLIVSTGTLFSTLWVASEANSSANEKADSLFAYTKRKDLADERNQKKVDKVNNFRFEKSIGISYSISKANNLSVRLLAQSIENEKENFNLINQSVISLTDIKPIILSDENRFGVTFKIIKAGGLPIQILEIAHSVAYGNVYKPNSNFSRPVLLIH